jgi:hypothetical protein
MKFCGVLAFTDDSGDSVRVKELIFRDCDMPFDLTLTYNGVPYEFSAVANRVSANEYAAHNVDALHPDGSKDLCSMTFVVGDRAETEIQISGELIDNGEMFPFDGELTLTT